MRLIYKIMNINDLDQELTLKYFPLLSASKQKKLLSNDNKRERSVLFCAEILARQCLSELCDAPEFSFDILCNPNSKSAVGNYSAEISIVSNGDMVACAVSYDYIGIGICDIRPFTFKEAQEILSDTEIRVVFADYGYSFNQIINSSKIESKSCVEKFAFFLALKEAYFNASGRGLRSIKKKIAFEINDNKVLCSDRSFEVKKSIFDVNNSIVVSVIERKKNHE